MENNLNVHDDDNDDDGINDDYFRKFKKKGIHRFKTPVRDIFESNYSYILISCPLQSRRVAYKL